MRLFLCLCVCLLCLTIPAPSPAFSAPPRQNSPQQPAKKTPAKPARKPASPASGAQKQSASPAHAKKTTPRAAAPGASQKTLASLIAAFDALQGDAAKASRRDNWLNLEKKFAILQKNSTGATAAEAAFYKARTREELAIRAAHKGDFRDAAASYKQMAATYPKHSRAPESLFRQASILDKRLDNAAAAQSVAKKLLAAYPASAEAKRAQTFLSAAPAAQPAKKITAAAPSSRPAAAARNSAATERRTLLEQLGLKIDTVMLDAGHGGKDPGTAANDITEKHLTISMAKRIGALLQKQGIKVIYTRSGDTYVPLKARPVRGNERKADLFISLHVNANTDASIRGVETYYLDTAQSNRAADVAARENAVTVKNVSDLQFILTDFMLSSKLEESKELAAHVQKGLLNTMRAGKYDMPDNGVRSAPFHVLMGARMPAILVEFGYVTNKRDAALLKNEAFLKRQADGVVAGILSYKKKISTYAPGR